MEELIENDYKALKNVKTTKKAQLAELWQEIMALKLGRGTALQHISCQQPRLSSEGRKEQHLEGRYRERQPFGPRQSLLPLVCPGSADCSQQKGPCVRAAGWNETEKGLEVMRMLALSRLPSAMSWDGVGESSECLIAKYRCQMDPLWSNPSLSSSEILHINNTASSYGFKLMVVLIRWLNHMHAEIS